MNKLNRLAQHRDALLLAEAIGWLHDYRKCSDEQLSGGGLSRGELGNKFSCLGNVEVFLLNSSQNVLELLKWDDQPTRQNFVWLGEYLIRCHHTAHFDKREPVGGQQNHRDIRLSTPFGFEGDQSVQKLTPRLWHLPWNSLCNYSPNLRDGVIRAVSELFSETIADTRRPINEVDLWSWGLLVGALYKAALAGALLTGNPPEAKDLRWRLLAVRVNGLDYLLNVARIPDLLARKELLEDSLNRVRHLLEVTYPLGSEVYRDENGSVYVVPDVADLLERTNCDNDRLQDLILKEFAQGTVKGKSEFKLGSEMIPYLALEQRPWWGQDPNWPNTSNDELPGIGDLLSRKITSPANAGQIERYWQNAEPADICTVCGLRPQGPNKKAIERNVCDICEERRADRSETWATSQPDRTIWTDEVADTNGRLALIVGQFDLTHWLDGRLVESLLLIPPHDPQNTQGKQITSKTPSFSRLRRIWETTRTFWREVQEECLKRLSDDRRRLQIYLNDKPNLGPFHVYDLVVGSTDLSVVWVPPHNNNDGYLITADNLSYIARQLGKEAGIYRHPATAAISVEDYLCEQFVKNGRQPILLNPDASIRQGSANLLAGMRITKVEYQENRYATAIPVLGEPRSFMLLVPADKSLDIVRFIKEKYEKEMGKVCDRLPLHLGCVYAHRRTPIRAVLDAGRAMLDHRTSSQQWRVKSVNSQTQTAAGDLELELERSSHYLQWRMPLIMGDGTTEDRWYPYFFLDTGGDDSKADELNRRAVKVSRPIGDKKQVECWIVHTADLRPGETIYLWPSTFDFEFLDTTARRFEIHYDQNGRRPRRTRPFYLEDLDRLEELWKYMERLTKTQRHQVIRTIEATREAWYGQDRDDKSTTDGVFEQFVADTLAGATWPQGQAWGSIPKQWQEQLIRAGVHGELTDLAELHMEILKE